MYFVDAADYNLPVEPQRVSVEKKTCADTDFEKLCNSDADIEWLHRENTNDIFQWTYDNIIFRKYQHVVCNKKYPRITISHVPEDKQLDSTDWQKSFHNFVPLYVKSQPDILHWSGYLPHKDHGSRSPLYAVK